MDRREQRRQHKEKEREQKNKHDQAYENEAQKATTAGSRMVDGCGPRADPTSRLRVDGLALVISARSPTSFTNFPTQRHHVGTFTQFSYCAGVCPSTGHTSRADGH